MIVNGKKRDFPSGITIHELVERMGFPVDIVMVKVDGKQIDKEDYERIELSEKSNVEIFSLIGGG